MTMTASAKTFGIKACRKGDSVSVGLKPCPFCCPKCRKVMDCVSIIVAKDASQGYVETYACSSCRVRSTREIKFYYDADEKVAVCDCTEECAWESQAINKRCRYGNDGNGLL